MSIALTSSTGNTQSLKRQRRAAAATVLLSLHEADQLANPEQWTWDVVDALPVWCLFDEQARSHMQLLCGALVLAPELRLWIDRELIVATQNLIGKQHFEHIVAKADSTPIAVNAMAASRFKTVSNKNSITSHVEAVLLQAGASVFKASLSDELPIDMLPKILGDTAGTVSHKVAGCILDQAQQLLDESPSGKVPA